MTDPDYFLTADVLALPGCSSFTEAQVLAAAAYFTSIVENELGVSLIQRSFAETLDGACSLALPLIQTRVTLVSVTVNGVTVSLSLLTVDAAGRLRYKNGCTRWSGATVANVVVTYTAGLYATCPADVKDAVMWATRDRLLSQSDAAGIDSRKTSMSNEMGGTTTYLLPGDKRPTGYPDLDAVIASRQRALGPAAG